MSSIIPHLHASLPSCRRGAESSPNPPAQTEFFSVVAEAKNARDLLAPAEQAHLGPALRATVAEVFNAFGFFEAGHTLARFPAEKKTLELPTDGLRPVTERVMASTIQDSFAAPQIDATAGPHPLFNSCGAEQPRVANASAARFHGSIPELRNATDVAQSVNVSASEITEDSPGESEPSEKPLLPDPPPEQRDRLIVRMGEHVVELLARMAHLSEEEETELLSAVQSILGARGLRLGHVSINGVPLGPGVFRSIS